MPKSASQAEKDYRKQLKMERNYSFHQQDYLDMQLCLKHGHRVYPVLVDRKSTQMKLEYQFKDKEPKTGQEEFHSDFLCHRVCRFYRALANKLRKKYGIS